MAVQYTNLHTTTYKDRILNSTAEEIATSSITVFAVELDNSNNTVASYAKFYNVSSSPSVGSDAPDMIIKVPKSTKMTVAIGNNGEGKVFGTGLFIAGVTTGGTSGSTDPTNDFVGTLYTS